jgi:hypothetical protein
LNKVAGPQVVVKVSVFRQRWPSAHVRGMDTMAVPGLFAMCVLALLVWAAINLLDAPILYPAATFRGPAAGVRVQSPACAEAARLRAHGATASTAYTRVRAACVRAGGP